MKRIFLFLALFLALSNFIPCKAWASDFFTRDYHILYLVKEDGKTTVSIEITLTNKNSDYYASSDTLSVGFSDIEDLQVSDPDGHIKALVTKNDQGANIQSNFNKKAVGLGKSITYKVSFETTDISEKSGKIWEINIPGLSDPNSIDIFVTEVKVPESFGHPTYVKPNTGNSNLIFTKSDLGKSAISISYGKEQIYEFDLSYHLQNSKLYPIKTEIALPPTTNYQRVEINSISPRPSDVIIDKDGNWLAQFELAPSARVDVKVKGVAKVELNPIQENLSQEQIRDYTKEVRYWEANNPQIKKIATKLKSPHAIYNYVVDNLNYDFNRVAASEPRLGAVNALKNPSSAVCLEFTDLFIALARAAGIPAREVNGYANTKNSKQRPLSLVQDVLHAWPEYYDLDRKTWIMVDPTWGNTTGGTDYFSVLDLDHLTFITKGYDSDYPIPPGGYKYSDDAKKKDVNVSFAKVFPQGNPLIKVSFETPEKVLSFLPISGTISIQNESSSLFPNTSGILASTSLFPNHQTIQIEDVPPFGKRKIQIGFDKTPFFANSSYEFTFSLQGNIIHKSVRVTPIALSRFALIGGILIALFSTVLLIIAFKTGRLPLFRQK